MGFSGPLILNDDDGGWVSVMPLAMRCRFKQIQRAGSKEPFMHIGV